MIILWQKIRYNASMFLEEVAGAKEKRYFIKCKQ